MRVSFEEEAHQAARVAHRQCASSLLCFPLSLPFIFHSSFSSCFPSSFFFQFFFFFSLFFSFLLPLPLSSPSPCFFQLSLINAKAIMQPARDHRQPQKQTTKRPAHTGGRAAMATRARPGCRGRHGTSGARQPAMVAPSAHYARRVRRTMQAELHVTIEKRAAGAGGGRRHGARFSQPIRPPQCTPRASASGRGRPAASCFDKEPPTLCAAVSVVGASLCR